MVSNGKRTIRICEWASLPVAELTFSQRSRIAELSENWRVSNNLPAAPLWFSGPEGQFLNARQYVGVVELAEVVIEIYPKLDKHLLEDKLVEDNFVADSVMRDLLWVLDVSNHLGVTEFGQASVEESPTSFYDIFALLLGKHLWRELNVGVPHAYLSVSDDIQCVRGRLRLLDQITRNMNRLDLIACEWDEFTPDIPMNRLLKSACYFLQTKVRSRNAARALSDCAAYLEAVSDVDALSALMGVVSHRWHRTNERFRPVFELARRLLQGSAHVLSSGEASTFVFLLDMNKVFEDFVSAVLAARYDVAVRDQEFVGKLLPELRRGGVHQYADYFWTGRDGVTWVGDAKYKHLSAGQEHALSWSEFEFGEDVAEATAVLAGRLLSSADIRQLTVYCELARKNRALPSSPNMILLYPFIGQGVFQADSARAWNGSDFWLSPVRMTQCESVQGALPANLPDGGVLSVNAAVGA